jgi:signal transduction histidine kinase
MAALLLTRSLALLVPIPRDRVVQRYSVALMTAAVAILLRWLLDPLLGHVAFYVTVYIAVTFCAIVCGYLPAILSGVLGFLGIFYWFVDPRHSLLLIRPSEIHSIVGAFLVCAVLIALGQANRSKQLQLNDSVYALTAEARERKSAQQELRRARDQLELRVKARTRELSEALARLESEVTVRQQAEQHLRYLSLRLMTLQDEERRRIARELHDTAGQTLAAMKMSIALISQTDGTTPGLQPLIDDLNALADDALQEVRTASYLLHPPLLDEAGIASAARWFVDGFVRRSGIQVQCEIQQGMPRPPRACELVLFRVLQESLTNVHRHSGATSASIHLNLDNSQFCLEISDNGRGIPEEDLRRMDTSSGRAGVGVSGMRERVGELGGHLEIRSCHPGTSVCVELPLATPGARSDQVTAFHRFNASGAPNLHGSSYSIRIEGNQVEGKSNVAL